MNQEGDTGAADAEPPDDERVLHGSAGTRQGGGTIDYADAITAQDAAWWATLSDYECTYGVLRALV